MSTLKVQMMCDYRNMNKIHVKTVLVNPELLKKKKKTPHEILLYFPQLHLCFSQIIELVTVFLFQ